MSKKKKNVLINITTVKLSINKGLSDSIVQALLNGGSLDPPNKDDYGRDAQFYKDLGVDPPEGLLKDPNEGQDELILEVSSKDMVSVESKSKVRASSILYIDKADSDYYNSIVYLSNGLKITAKETVKKLENRINKVERNGVQ